MTGVSFVVPVHNGARWIRETLLSILDQTRGWPAEIIVVDDKSDDESAALVQELGANGPVRLISSGGRGAAAAINTGIQIARFPIICQIDQDVVLGPGWLERVVAEFDDPAVAAAQGYYTADPSATLFARIMGWDLEHRYAGIAGDVDHVCTGNSAYRADALREVGLFDTTLGYGYDNDISYRLRQAGYRLVIVREARSDHRWREGFAGYFLQQYGFGYGRLDLVAKHPRRVTGDSVSRSGMMAHPLVTLAALAGFASAAATAAFGLEWRPIAVSSAALFAALAIERFVAGVSAARRFGHFTPLLFPLFHLLRDLAWVAAIVIWCARRLAGRPVLPADSMRPGARAAAVPIRGSNTQQPIAAGKPLRVLCIIPAHNEADSLPEVIEEVRMASPQMDILVVDDGSSDETAEIANGLGVDLMRFCQHLGVGSAVRAGLRYADRAGYDAAVRIDGDGQHWPGDIQRLLALISVGHADVVFGSRFSGESSRRGGPVRFLQRLLARGLSLMTGRTVTDPTSGFCAFNQRAVRLLAKYHPTGYPEPELVLLLSRCGLTAVETPVGDHRRLGGRTSLTPARVTVAMARVMLAMVIVPLRRPIEEIYGD